MCWLIPFAPPELHFNMTRPCISSTIDTNMFNPFLLVLQKQVEAHPLSVTFQCCAGFFSNIPVGCTTNAHNSPVDSVENKLQQVVCKIEG